APPHIYTLSLHDALPIFRIQNALYGAGEIALESARELRRSGHENRKCASLARSWRKGRLELHQRRRWGTAKSARLGKRNFSALRSEEHTSELQSPCNLVC